MKTSVLAGVLFGFALLVSPAWAAAPSSCVFLLGFAQLHDLLPGIVGDCASDELHDPRTGDALQQTTNGLLVWRKSDNWTAFTDGSQSWVNGPLGLQQRQNEQRFWWEANPAGLAIVPMPLPGERCHTAGLSLTPGRVDAGAGNRVGAFRLNNTLDVDCTFFGYPGAQLLDETGTPLPTTVVRGGGYFPSSPTPSLVDVPAHAQALFRIHWEQVPVGDETSCPTASSIAITPPDEYVALSVAAQISACGGGQLDMSPVQPNAPDCARYSCSENSSIRR